MTSAPVVSKVWSFCNTLRDDGVGYGNYLELLTYPIFLKMADEYINPPYKGAFHMLDPVPKFKATPSLSSAALPPWQRESSAGYD